MAKFATGLLTTAMFLVTLLFAGCKSSTTKDASVMAAAPPANAAPAVVAPPAEPPTVDVGIGVDQAYQAIPHRRTMWREDDSSVPAGEVPYLRAIFEVLDQAVAVRVAAQQNFANRSFDSPDIDGQYERLLSYARSMPVPSTLASYHSKVLEALAGERQYFADWKSARDGFAFGRDVAGHPGVRKASADLRAAYGELMGKYPQESQNNKDAFFDYHCALDFL